jgi:hypothetical protein
MPASDLTPTSTGGARGWSGRCWVAPDRRASLARDRAMRTRRAMSDRNVAGFHGANERGGGEEDIVPGSAAAI